MICSCRTATKQFVGLDTNVVITTPAPIQEETAINNDGTSGLGVTLQIFTDRTYTSRLGPGQFLPDGEKRFFIQAKTEFQKDHISMRSCIATQDADTQSVPV